MAKILCIETSTDVCSVCIAIDGIATHTKEDKARNHASLLAVYIEQALEESKIKAKDLDAVAISSGPGSYTGLRIGTSTAKGIAYQTGIKLIAVNTLQAYITKAITSPSPKDTQYVAVSDAGRNEVYAQTFDINNKPLSQCRAEIITPQSYQTDTHIVFAGNAADKISKILLHNSKNTFMQMSPSASNMSQLAQEAFNNSNFEDVAYFEPYYLKDFIATVSKKNPLKK